MPDVRWNDVQDLDARILRASRHREGTHRVRPLWNSDARVQARRTTGHLRMDTNQEREEEMKTRNSFEMVRTRARMRWQACREIAMIGGWSAAVRAMALGVA